MTASTLGYRRATPTEVAGHLTLAVAHDGYRTRPVTTDGRGVLQLKQPMYLDESGQVTYLLVNPGGAYFGERYHYVVDVGSGANLLLSTQGATRIYRTPVEPAVQESRFTLAAGSRLEYVPDQTIAYRNATYRQWTRLVAHPQAQGFISDIITPGWDPDGAKFTYSDLHLRLEVCSDGSSHDGVSRPVCVDNVRIQPREIGDAVHGIGYLEGRTHMGTVLVVGAHAGEGYRDGIRDVVGRLHRLRVGVTTGDRHGVSWLMVRALADSTDALNEMVLVCNEFDRSVTTGQGRLDLRRY